MKIGIFTIFDAYNYGSFLQAFASQTFLETLGHEVYMIDIRTTLKSHIAQKYLAKSVSRSILKFKRWNAYHHDWHDLNIVSLKKYPDLDLAIIGSDEVWNIENESFDHAPQFYGEGIRANRIICYAPSLGYSTLNDYSHREFYIKSIKKHIAWVGARDYFTRDFLLQIGFDNVDMVCDPTLFLNNKWGVFEKEYHLNYPYMIYYSYLEDTSFKEYILKFAREFGLKVISVGFNYKWCDEQLIVSPKQFLSLVRNASFIVTSTFHGTVFSTLYHKQFIQIEPAKKAVDYLNQLGIVHEVKFEDGYGSFKNHLIKKIDYTEINKVIDEWKNHSIKLLKQKVNII